ncbi:MAG: DUF134 domain-containing protein [Clostridiales bacterium]|nr:DUF134 domain-containing protein [Clostridiales bacterium]
MPRPRKWRNVCRMPGCSRFGPLDPCRHDDPIVMSVDEYETIRLIDLEELTQEECARQMNVARTTVQGIYNDARKKLAGALIGGRLLLIEGGDYRLCGGDGQSRPEGCCRRRQCWRDQEQHHCHDHGDMETEDVG